MRTVNAPHREPDDAPDRRPGSSRRRRLLLLAAAMALFNAFVAVVYGGTRPRAPADTPAPPPPAVAAPVVAAPVVAAPVVQAPPAAVPEPAPPVTRTPAKTRPPRERRGGSLAPVVVDNVVGSDRVARAVVERDLRRRLADAGVEVAHDTGYAVTLRVDVEREGSAVTVRCGAALARLPGHNVVGSLKARADVDGDGATPAELTNDAAAACTDALATDLTTWLAKHPP